MQVLSSSVANALQFYGNPDTTETERFVRTFDKFFDCLNVRSPNEHITKRKEHMKPYSSASDERLLVGFAVVTYMYIHTNNNLQWLERDFLDYLNEWQSSVAARDGFTSAEKAMMTLSRETLEGLRVTGMSA